MNYFIGRIELIFGPMFAGKTTELIRRIQRAEKANLKCILIKYSNDDRYSKDCISTHDMAMLKATPTNKLTTLESLCTKFDVIGIDEGQFFPDIIEFCESLVSLGKTLIIAGLDGTFQAKPFGNILNLISRCEKITKLSAICVETSNEASFTKRIVDSTDIELIGGDSIYKAASRNAFNGISGAGEIHLTLGPVKSGKTTELIRLLYRHKIAKRNPILLYPQTRHFANEVKFDTKPITALPDYAALDSYDVVGIDEAQNYANVAEWCNALANGGKLIIVSAMSGNIRQEPFASIVELFPLCERVQMLDSICPLIGAPAPFSIEFNNDVIPISRFGLSHIRNLTGWKIDKLLK